MVGVRVSSASDGNAGLSRSLGTQGPDRRVWVAEVSVPERYLACQTQLAPIHLAIQCLRRWVSVTLCWWCVAGASGNNLGKPGAGRRKRNDGI